MELYYASEGKRKKKNYEKNKLNRERGTGIYRFKTLNKKKIINQILPHFYYSRTRNKYPYQNRLDFNAVNLRTIYIKKKKKKTNVLLFFFLALYYKPKLFIDQKEFFGRRAIKLISSVEFLPHLLYVYFVTL